MIELVKETPSWRQVVDQKCIFQKVCRIWNFLLGFVIGNRAVLERTRTLLDVSVSETGNTTTVNVFIFESPFH